MSAVTPGWTRVKLLRTSWWEVGSEVPPPASSGQWGARRRARRICRGSTASSAGCRAQLSPARGTWREIPPNQRFVLHAPRCPRHAVRTSVEQFLTRRCTKCCTEALEKSSSWPSGVFNTQPWLSGVPKPPQPVACLSTFKGALSAVFTGVCVPQPLSGQQQTVSSPQFSMRSLLTLQRARSGSSPWSNVCAPRSRLSTVKIWPVPLNGPCLWRRTYS